MITVFGSLIAVTVALEISQAFSRFYRDEKTDEGKKVLASTALWFTILMFFGISDRDFSLCTGTLSHCDWYTWA